MVFRRYCTQNVKVGIQIQVYYINESVNHSSQFISVEVKKSLRKSQAQFREKLRKLRLRQNNVFFIKKDMDTKRNQLQQIDDDKQIDPIYYA